MLALLLPKRDIGNKFLDAGRFCSKIALGVGLRAYGDRKRDTVRICK